MTPEYGERLDGLMRYRSCDLCGVLNGIDYDEYNPCTTEHRNNRRDRIR